MEQKHRTKRFCLTTNVCGGGEYREKANKFNQKALIRPAWSPKDQLAHKLRGNAGLVFMRLHRIARKPTFSFRIAFHHDWVHCIQW